MKIVNKIIQFFYFIIVIYISTIISGCAGIFGTSRNVTFITKQDSVKVVAYPNFDIGGDSIIVPMHGNKGTVKLKDKMKYYTIKEEKKGYETKSIYVNVNNLNAWKLLDMLVPLSCDVYLLSGAGSTTVNNPAGGTTVQEGHLFPFALYGGTFGWAMIFFGHWATYNKEYALPELQHALPVGHTLLDTNRRADSSKKVYVKNVAINISKDSMVEYYYQSPEDYNKHKSYKKEYIGDAYTVKHSIYRDSLNDYLMRWNYIDTNKGFFSFVYKKSCYIRCTVEGITINTIGSKTVFNLRSDWKLYGVTGDKEIYKTKLTGLSEMRNFYITDYTVGTLMTDALTEALAQFLDLDTVSKCLASHTANMKAMNDWDTLKFSDSGMVKSLQEAVKAVVTVKTPEGHGSGCIVSHDGYIVTNYHVIAEDTSDEVKIITSDGDSLKAKYIRSNTSYDLALLKIEKAGNYKFFSPNLSAEINVGTEVYAIGTPTDIELGQTMTRGIISSKRKIGDRILIQTDVSVNPGNSGGGLVDDKGVLQGIVNASLIRWGVQGISFAIPAHYIQDALKIKFVQR